MDDKQKEEAMFMQLILTFQMAAWQQMGKIKNPITDKVERNLEQARFSVDMLEVIRKKTQSNLSEQEKGFLDRSISELQLNFIDEMEKAKKEKAKKATAEKTEEKTTEEEKKPEVKTEKAQEKAKKTTKKRTGKAE